MFGYLVGATEMMREDELRRYKACYCGLCRALKERHGQHARLTLNYDMTFLILVLSSLYEPKEQSGADRCLRHPSAPQDWATSEISAYAADVNVALAYLKCMDDWEDDGSLAALAEARSLRAGYEKVRAEYPRQCAAMEDAIARLRAIERENREAPDEAAGCFGALMAELFVYKEDRWSRALRGMGGALGRTIYLMDACMDLDADTRRNRYNPFRRYYGLDNAERFRDILKMQLGDCVRWFDMLPLVQDAGLMKNILCAGLWTQFNRKFGRKDP